MSVNVLAHQLMAPDFTTAVTTVLDRAETDPGLVTLEVTESVFVQDTDRALVVLNELKDLGVTLALDDFGTGYSSLNYLSDSRSMLSRSTKGSSPTWSTIERVTPSSSRSSSWPTCSA